MERLLFQSFRNSNKVRKAKYQFSTKLGQEFSKIHLKIQKTT